MPAASDTSSEVLTLACAGSGKSRTLAFRIARLIAEGQDPRGIVAFTFTEKAAESIKSRAADALRSCGLAPTVLGAMYIGTIHAYCQDVLRQMDARFRQVDALDDNRFKLFLISRYAALGLAPLRPRVRGNSYFELIKRASQAWTTTNDELVNIQDVTIHDEPLGRTLERIRDRMDADHFIDFSLMIRLVVDALRDNHPGAERAVSSLTHLMVDEYQDVNPAQEALIEELRRRCHSLFVVGDDDQSIYAWRGADVQNILTFQQRYPAATDHTLNVNYRSTEPIVAAADDFVRAELGPTRIEKHPTANNPTPTPRDFRVLWFPNRQDEATWVAARIQALLGTEYREEQADGTVRVRGLTPADFAILMRSTRQPEQDGVPRHVPFSGALSSLGIAFSLEAGGGAFDRPQVAVLRDTFNLLRNGSPTRKDARAHFDGEVLPVYPQADFNLFANVIARWGREIHAPTNSGPRRRVFPQGLLHDVLQAFGLSQTTFDAGVMHDIGLFSRMMQDVESVYVSIDSPGRYGDILNFLSNAAETGYDSNTDDVLLRPDAVTVATVHKVKGLEFPVVFIVDAENQRFPGKAGSYDGLLPAQVVQGAIARGAYQNTRADEARLFYTAMTRAERYLYITGCELLPGGKQRRKPSTFSARLSNQEISDDASVLPHGLVPHQQIRRIDETVMPTSYSDIRYYLRCPRDYQFRKSFDFSPPITEMFGFGMTVHSSIGKLHELFPNHPPEPDEAEGIARQNFHLKHIPPSADPQNRPGGYERAQDSAGTIARNYAEQYGGDFEHERQVEVRFEVPVTQAVISGSIDLLLRFDADGNIAEARVIDFKAMEGGPEPEQNEDLQWTEMSLQVQLYATAARDVLGENARTGAVHLLKDNQRIDVPVDDDAVASAVANVEWAVDRIIAGDFPMRPQADKCAGCDFAKLCPRVPEDFATATTPPPLHVPGNEFRMARAFSEYDGSGG